jgi:hypothetical protein
MVTRHRLDSLIAKLMSRKLFVFLTACTFIVLGSIDPLSWTQIATFYLGSQGVIDVVKAWRE